MFHTTFVWNILYLWTDFNNCRVVSFVPWLWSTWLSISIHTYWAKRGLYLILEPLFTHAEQSEASTLIVNPKPCSPSKAWPLPYLWTHFHARRAEWGLYLIVNPILPRMASKASPLPDRQMQSKVSPLPDCQLLSMHAPSKERSCYLVGKQGWQHAEGSGANSRAT